MPTYRERVDAKGQTRLQVIIRVSGHPPIVKTFPISTENKTRAKEDRKRIERWADDQEQLIREGKAPAAAATRVKFSKLLPEYIRTVKGRKLRDERKTLLHLEEWDEKLGAYKLSMISKALLTSKVSELNECYSPSTVQGRIASLSGYFTWLVEVQEMLPSNPLKKVEKPPLPSGRTRFLDDDEQTRLLAACRASSNRDLYVMVVIAIYTGLRRAEILNLTWDRVSLEHRRITVRGKGGKIRTVPLRGPALDALRNRVRTIGVSRVFTCKHFPQAAWETVVKRAKLEDFVFHSLRHTCASYMAQTGASLLEIADVLGHSSVKVTERYSHLTTERTGDVMDRMIERFGNGNG